MKYTIDNPKLVKYCYNPEKNNFTGVVKDEFGNIAYYKNNKIHRLDGPAIISANGYKEWRIHGECHREDGPATEFPNGEINWYYNGYICGVNDDFTIESWIKKCLLEIFK